MSRFPHYRDSPEARLFPLPNRRLGAGLRRRVRRLDPALPLAAVFGLRTAAYLHGLDILPRSVSEDYWPVEVIVPPRVEVPARPGLRVYRWGLGTEVEQVDGVLVTSRARTALDCARVLPRLDAVAAVDQFLRAGVELAALRRIAAAGDHQEARAANSVLDLTDAKAESPLESWTRCLIADAGLPQPTAQVPVVLRDGSLAHLDLGYRALKVGIECNGRRFHGSETAREYDSRRRRSLEANGWSVHAVYGSDVVVRPEDLLTEVQWRLLRSGWRPTQDRLARVEKRTRYIAMALRLEREDWNAAWGLPDSAASRPGRGVWRRARP